MVLQTSEFLAVLNEEKVCLTDLLTLAERKKEAILANNMASLEKITFQEEQKAAELKIIEQKRCQLTWQKARLLKLPKEYRIFDIIQSFPPDEAHTIDNVCQEIRDTILHLKKLQSLNNILIRDSLSYVNYMLSILTGTRSKCIYTPNGQVNDTQKAPSQMDFRK